MITGRGLECEAGGTKPGLVFNTRRANVPPGPARHYCSARPGRPAIRSVSGRRRDRSLGRVKDFGQRQPEGVGEFGQLLLGGMDGATGPVLSESPDTRRADTGPLCESLHSQVPAAHGHLQEFSKVGHFPRLPRPGPATPGLPMVGARPETALGSVHTPVPRGQASPARHPGTEAELLGQVLPIGCRSAVRTGSRTEPAGQEPRPPSDQLGRRLWQ